MAEYSIQVSGSQVSIPSQLADSLSLILSIPPSMARNSITLQSEELFQQLFNHQNLVNIRVHLEFEIQQPRRRTTNTTTSTTSTSSNNNTSSTNAADSSGATNANITIPQIPQQRDSTTTGSSSITNTGRVGVRLNQSTTPPPSNTNNNSRTTNVNNHINTSPNNNNNTSRINMLMTNNTTTGTTQNSDEQVVTTRHPPPRRTTNTTSTSSNNISSSTHTNSSSTTNANNTIPQIPQQMDTTTSSSSSISNTGRVGARLGSATCAPPLSNNNRTTGNNNINTPVVVNNSRSSNSVASRITHFTQLIDNNGSNNKSTSAASDLPTATQNNSTTRRTNPSLSQSGSTTTSSSTTSNTNGGGGSVMERVRQMRSTTANSSLVASNVVNTQQGNSQLLNRSQQEPQQQEPQRTCLICFDPIERQLQLKNCKCDVCETCQIDTFKNLQFTTERELYCAMCKQPYIHKDIAKHVSDAHRTRFSNLKTELLHLPSEFDVECSYCSKMLDSRNANSNNRLECFYCHEIICVKHKCPWHFNKTCNEIDYEMDAGRRDRDSMYFIDHNYKECNNCHARIEKNDGCDHMTCTCGYEFCYVCGADYNNIRQYGNHYHKPECRYHSDNIR